MSTKYLLSLTFIFCLFSANMTFSQSKQKPLQHVVYNANVNDPLTDQELSFITEVYGNRADQDILSKPQRLKDIKNILRNRVIITEVPQGKDLSSITNLSTVPLYNPYNKNIIRDMSYNAGKFNPLKYQFNFYSREGAKTFRFDNSQVLITIKSQYDL